MKWVNRLVLVMLSLWLVGCVAPSAEPAAPAEEPVEYNYDSWRTLIPDTCTHFFDGCNKCTRAPGADMAACTRMACMKYEKPVCLDDQAQAKVLDQSVSTR